MFVPSDFILKVLLTIGLGSLIGFEREFFNKPAGLRTNILVMLGSMLAAYISSCFEGTDITRIAANILTGLGFIGGGVIIQSKGSVRGLTTASCIWICGIIGMAIGFTYYIEALIVSVVTFVVLYVLGYLECFMKRRRKI